jgi:hypothetical protein
MLGDPCLENIVQFLLVTRNAKVVHTTENRQRKTSDTTPISKTT